MITSTASAVVATAAVLTAAGYQSMAPKGQWYGSTFTGAMRGSKQLALTYDDGPNDPDTLRLLDVLAKHDVRATFFLLGRHVRMRPDIAREVVKAGHIVGNHTFSHPLLIFQPVARVRAQILECQQAIAEATSVTPALFRPPFGGRRPAVLKIAREMGLQPVMWTVTGFDWDARSSEAIEGKVSRQIRGGDVILLHDGGHLGIGADRSKTIVATERLIAQYKAQGYEFVTVPEMMGVRS
jgi:peptidoglycan/xylan/chitin deacetylase (PgdA/CDA1 family)